MNEKHETADRPLAIDRIRTKVRALIRPTALDFFLVGAEARNGLEHEERRALARVLEIRDRGRTAAARLIAVAGGPPAGRPERYDVHIRKSAKGD